MFATSCAPTDRRTSISGTASGGPGASAGTETPDDDGKRRIELQEPAVNGSAPRPQCGPPTGRHPVNERSASATSSRPPDCPNLSSHAAHSCPAKISAGSSGSYIAEGSRSGRMVQISWATPADRAPRTTRARASPRRSTVVQRLPDLRERLDVQPVRVLDPRRARSHLAWHGQDTKRLRAIAWQRSDTFLRAVVEDTCPRRALRRQERSMAARLHRERQVGRGPARTIAAAASTRKLSLRRAVHETADIPRLAWRVAMDSSRRILTPNGTARSWRSGRAVPTRLLRRRRHQMSRTCLRSPRAC